MAVEKRAGVGSSGHELEMEMGGAGTPINSRKQGADKQRGEK